MPPQGREILGLRFYQDLSLEETAGTLGFGLSAAKMRLYRSLDQYANLLPQEAKQMLA